CFGRRRPEAQKTPSDGRQSRVSKRSLIALETTTYLRALPAAISGTLGFSHERACGQWNRAGKEKI
ncbi:hypothetical protein, partial [Mesorhizobium sp.]|uniref:hypothetical protein n=1 Tax=Mesorhizobium sp. TaxID=1871066 RepID=UPI0025DE8C15